MLFLLFDSIIYSGLAVYLSFVVPKEFGAQKAWHFPITDIINKYKTQKRIKKDGVVNNL
jgi:hypothetical protein